MHSSIAAAWALTDGAGAVQLFADIVEAITAQTALLEHSGFPAFSRTNIRMLVITTPDIATIH